MDMYKVVVCDDNKEFLKLMMRLLGKYTELYDIEIEGFATGQELMEYCSNNSVDIIYMDIEVGKDNGMSMGKMLKSANPKALIVYISAYDTYYVDMVQAEPFRFILKDASDIPKLEREIVDILDAAIRRVSPPKIWTFSFNKRKYSLELGKVQYIYSIARTIHIVGDIGNVPAYFYGKLDEIQKEIEKIDDNFARINKSYIVNMKYGVIYGKNRVMICEKILNVTRNYRHTIDEGFHYKHWKMVIPPR
ncbi:MAG: LytTR family DNA-binding domain-containing protein [Lachnospiraceae bacterium]|nr:LytTR family DNA-binding domain-containing protein [Lachnospiraceae bacterium]